jgi:PAS domain-containing protein
MKTSLRNAGLIVCLGAEQKIREGEATLRRILDAAIDGMSINKVATGNYYIDVNESFAQISGYTREELIGSCSCKLGLWRDEEDWRFFVDSLDIIGGIQQLASAPYQETSAQEIATAIIRCLNSEAAMGNL